MGEHIFLADVFLFWTSRTFDFLRFSKDFSGSRQSFQVLRKVSGTGMCCACGRPVPETFAENLKTFAENLKTSKRTAKNRMFSKSKKVKHLQEI